MQIPDTPAVLQRLLKAGATPAEIMDHLDLAQLASYALALQIRLWAPQALAGVGPGALRLAELVADRIDDAGLLGPQPPVLQLANTRDNFWELRPQAGDPPLLSGDYRVVVFMDQTEVDTNFAALLFGGLVEGGSRCVGAAALVHHRPDPQVHRLQAQQVPYCYLAQRWP